MAKDPAFLFYPGDASEDTQFMNRLERGCYFDILKAQKKFGRFSLDQIKKVLGGDFDSCWPALEIVLKSENGFYFIEWVDDAVTARKAFSESRRNNRKGKKSSEKEVNQTSLSYDEDMKNICSSSDDHMENENENGNEIKNEINKGGTGENSVPNYLVDGEPVDDLKSFLENNFQALMNGLKKNYGEITFNEAMKDFSLRHLQADWPSEQDLRKHFSNFLMKYSINNGKSNDEKNGQGYGNKKPLSSSIKVNTGKGMGEF
jgi:hypothetical protein